MDPITQGALGAIVVQAATAKKLGPKKSLLIGALSGMAADLDVLITAGKDILGHGLYHRHFTHSLFFAPIGGLLCALVFYFLFPSLRNKKKTLIFASILGYLTHAPLDCLTTYGTLFYWPFSQTRVSLDIMPIIDPVYTLCLIGFIIAATVKDSQKWARIGLVVSSLYVCFAWTQHYKATVLQKELASTRGHENLQHIRVMPAPGSLLLWRSVYQHEDRYFSDGFRVGYTGELQIASGNSDAVYTYQDYLNSNYKSKANEFGVQHFFQFAQSYIIKRQDPITHEIKLLDYRYSGEISKYQPLWGISVTPEKVSWKRMMNNREQMGKRFLEMMKGKLKSEG